ncbi:MAG TPA: DsbA family protein [Candidatus Saccharimonadales bacterium]|nr:DsbA family protein [Candidatus Saccharimonadales bacterium]
MTKTRWIIFAVICLLLLGGIAVLANQKRVDVSGIDASAVIKDGDFPDHVVGDADSKVVFIEYGDYQCPICGSVAQPLKDTLQPYIEQGKIAFVFRNYPLTSIHPNTLAAASAAEAAGLQGKYWQMHDKLYESQDAWANAAPDQRQTYFDGYAQDLGLNVDQFRTDMASKQVSRHVARDRALGEKINVTGTPTFVLNGKKLESSINSALQNGDSAELEKLLDQAIKDTGGQPPKQ